MNQKLVAVIDYGMGNLRSVSKAAEHMTNDETQIVVTHDPQVIADADAIIFPGQGAAKACMQALQDTGMIHPVQQAAKEKPFLGICMGLQVLMSHSDENQGIDCLDIIPGKVVQFDLSGHPELKMPHMGWNQIHQTQDHPLWHGIPQDSRFYFVHSYYVAPQDKSTVIGETTHGQTFPSVLSAHNIFAIQAHPEKSAEHGLQLFKNFLEWNGH
ncbi:imidazole glycerol phosphate synthase subunit HisH [Thiomicrorhabdus heinhorstiae]|uniref:Imidazole glycerol phosphate synthase subunit HisH n=1 Tax=Thiomicrorhabdus heinhorstiae TaxID=2748010 RepID=A0ABS0BWL1_9GAMM|nr:imidazole glycerol phosphate synthase subunit HisH [Thiomicrorhabdus heinhorstiae]MBF6057455.1 imidazole glycerol phosphate synthase subunit HisH [Thiomicrorhabdus heinhorstiae]